jgi:hypothetical protein
MMTKSKIALIAAFVLGTASAAFAQSSGEEIQNSQYQINPNAPVPVYSKPAPDAGGVAADHEFRGQRLIEGRNVSVRSAPEQFGVPAIEERYPSFGGY